MCDDIIKPNPYSSTYLCSLCTREGGKKRTAAFECIELKFDWRYGSFSQEPLSNQFCTMNFNNRIHLKGKFGHEYSYFLDWYWYS